MTKHPNRFRAKWVPFLAAALIGASPAFGQQENPSVRALLRFSIVPDADRSPEGRVRFAEALAMFCKDTLKAIPTNTPREADWVAREMNTSDNARIGRLVRTAEYSRFRLATDFQECVEKTEKLRGAQASGIWKDEAFWFASLIATFNNDRDFVLHAKQAGVNTEQTGIDWLSTIRYGLTVAALRSLDSPRR